MHLEQLEGWYHEYCFGKVHNIEHLEGWYYPRQQNEHYCFGSRVHLEERVVEEVLKALYKYCFGRVVHLEQPQLGLEEQ